ncbi:MAG: hypothetical protein Q9203_003957 [Teloschistes exilis]
MSDSVRKSNRATKGQHTKNFEPADTPTTKRGRKGKGSKAAKQVAAEATQEDEGDAIIRCICGYVEEDEDDERKMIVCDKCEAWQHNECMEMSLDDNELPDQYFCEQCRPDLHRALLDKVANGLRPWEERAKQRELEEEQERERKRKKKGKKPGRPSNVKPIPQPAPAPEAEHEPAKSNGVPDTPSTAVPPAVPTEPATPVEAPQKRKLPDDSPSEVKTPSQQEPQSKVRKVSSSAEQKPPMSAPRRKSSAILTSTPTSGKAAQAKRDSKPSQQMELVGSISDLQHEARKKIASALVKLFVEQTKRAQEEGSFIAPGNQPDALGNKLGLAVEHAMFFNCWGNATEPSSNYRDKFRMIDYNVKRNPVLRNRLLTGELSPNDVSKMTSHDMASKDLQEMTAEMKRVSDKQAILVEQQGPRIRRTHKGEEFVEAPDGQGPPAPDTVFSAPVRRVRPIDEGDVPKPTSPEPTSPQTPSQTVELPENVGTAMASPKTAQPLSVDTKVPPKSERQASSNFNIQDVWSSVTGPDADGQKQRQSFPLPENEQAVAGVSGGSGDADIDRLLKDEDQEEEEPYSPTEYPADPNAPVWHGKLVMPGVTEFSGEGKHVAGANLSATIPWSQIMAPTLNIEGRIPIERASEYLCGLRYSSSTDVSVVAITPSDSEESRMAFDKLFHYFVERKRWGVVGKNTTKEVKDIYIAPLEAGVTTKPEFLELLEQCTIPSPIPERMLLITFVIRAHNSPTTGGGPESTPRPLDTAAVASPVNAGNFQTPTPFPAPTPPVGYHGSPGTATGPYHNSPPQPQAGFLGSPSQHHLQHPYGIPSHHQQQQTPYPQPPYNGPVGLEAAKQALGEMINAPTVAPLLHDAPGVGVYELGIVRELFEQVPATKENWEMLKGMLAMKLTEGSGGGGGGGGGV